MSNDKESAPGTASSVPGYTVVARRYRPKSFEELIGQDHIAQALGKAISSGRVGHAYLFTGARGVGKTSTARIFAKALNAFDGGDVELSTEIAAAIDSGDDMDVIEIDGASNRGIEEIRQLRANVSVRPSRAKHKIYIIDEVHMLTNQAFNALLKTLEEPPEHVKFIFCTTDPDKIPITVLSRCQRFDFAPVKFEAIQKRLQEISEAEGYEADEEALALLARRAAGSMRDSQSLLEQVMSFSVGVITAEQVHALLGTADEGRLLSLVETMRDANALKAIELVEEATRGGSDPGQIAEQLLNYLRDLMAIAVGGGPELLKLANPAGHGKLKELADSWGTQTILSAIQILDESLVRMRTSVSSATLLEVSLVQICQLEKLASIPALLEAVLKNPRTLGAPRQSAAASGGTGEKKKHEVNVASPVATIDSTTRPSGFSGPAETPASSEANAVDSTGGDSARGDAVQDPQDGAAVDSSESKVADVRSAEDATAEDKKVGETVNSPPGAVTPTDAGPTPVASKPTVDAPSESSTNHASSAKEGQPNGDSSEVKTSDSAHAGGSAECLTQWNKALGSIGGMLSDFASIVVRIEPVDSESWKVVFPPGGQKALEYCDQGNRRSELMNALKQLLGRTIQLQYSVIPGAPPAPLKSTANTSAARAQKMREIAENPYVKQLCEALGGEILRVDPPRIPPNATLHQNSQAKIAT